VHREIVLNGGDVRNEQEEGKRSRARTVGYWRGGCLFGG